jgi:hypothetical protein
VTAELAAPGTSTSPTQLRLAGSSDIDEQLTPETRSPSINEPCTSVYRICCSFKIITSWHKVVPLAKMDLQRKIVVLTIVTFTIRHARGVLQGDDIATCRSPPPLQKSPASNRLSKPKRAAHARASWRKTVQLNYVLLKSFLMQSSGGFCPILTGRGAVQLGKPFTAASHIAGAKASTIIPVNGQR